MATSSYRDSVCLLESSGDESFDIIDSTFDPAFSELTGVASADFIPMDKGEIFVKKGDRVKVEEETLDRQYYVVTLMATGESGRVPKEFVDVSDSRQTNKGSKFTEDGKEPLSNKKSPLKRHQGIIRHPGVEKNKRPYLKLKENGLDPDSHSPERQSASLDTCPQALVRQSASMDAGPMRQSKGLVTDPQPLVKQSASVDIAQPVIGKSPAGHSQSPHTASRKSRDFTASDPGGSPVARLRDLMKEDRSHTIQLLPESRPEFKLIEKYNILSVSGSDRDGRPVIVFSACRLPPTYLINHQRLLEYFLLTLDKYVEQDYTFIYFHHGLSSSNKPSLGWIRQVYKEMDRKYKKNIKKFYIVHPTNFIKILYYIFKPLISYKFGQKLVYINRLDELRPVLYLDQIDIPDEVKKYDLTITAPIRDVTHSESRSVFHVSVDSPHATSDPTTFELTRQFGVPLDVLRERHNGDPVPPVLKLCVQYLEEHGLEVVGIFRRAPNNATVHQIKRRLDAGEQVELSEYGDCHLPAVIMKLFLRELPQPLLTFEAYPLIADIRGKSEEHRLEICDRVLNSLPETNYIVLRYLIEFLTQVSARQEVNKMTELNLAIVFGPNLVWSVSEVASLASLGEINTFTCLLIQHYDALFNK